MTQVDFYHHVANPSLFACRLAQTVYRRGESLLILLEDEAARSQLDALLWTFQAGSFVPHCRAEEAIASETPILLSCIAPISPPHLVLNLPAEPPPDLAKDTRILELIGQAPDALARARTVARTYKAQGFDITYHDMAQH